MRPLAPLLLAVPALLAASAPVADRPRPVIDALRAATAEARSADAEQQRLERAAKAARGQAASLHAQQRAAAQAIVAAEARIGAADAEHRLALAGLQSLRSRLERRQRPVASLLAGLAMMAHRPPLLALADGSGTDEMVRIRLLLDSTLPVIRSRAAALTAELEGLETLERRSLATRAALAASRTRLREKQQMFARLEARALQRAELQGAGALGAGDLALAAGEKAELLAREAESARSAAGIARELASLGPGPASPFAGPGIPAPPIRYRLPAVVPLTQGFGAVGAAGIRSRGIGLATARGAPLEAPADGIVRFAGPFRDYDGIVIIDHGGGWISLIVNASSPLKRGSRVRIGDPLGHALGPVEVELSGRGRRLSPAIIAGSSRIVSNDGKDG